MSKEDVEKRIVENYKNDEKMMILIFVQWCVNHDLDPVVLYEDAYPGQHKNNVLLETIEQAVPKNEAEEVSDQTVLNVLQLFGNDDLAFTVQAEIEKRGK
ncbi:hypothetical protein CV093_03030 [Oceanobacillus sp. 143]|uniref:Uncharacterized protein n=1 Tax=Oceanobacillus zhaokaii TaxID=2052660 RepID=A0A345PDB9_9BACI|nr:hypothetical protein [Oceanobacillus zhaokaii]AXI07999.1 hypothetical protein CUC15_02940 [Oceanobacillus zhaokaii]QGS68023.1 hypothetical protein CV093_03030 [Oceanobacillus sp. 143]